MLTVKTPLTTKVTVSDSYTLYTPLDRGRFLLIAHVKDIISNVEFVGQTFREGGSCVRLLARLLALQESHVFNQASFSLQTKSAAINKSYIYSRVLFEHVYSCGKHLSKYALTQCTF